MSSAGPARVVAGEVAPRPIVERECAVPPAFPISLAVALALLTAWADFGARFVKQLLPGGPVGMGPDALWMGPIMNLIWLGIPALALAWLARRRGSRLTPVVVLGTLGFIALSDLLLSHRRLHAGAELLVALGLTIQLAPRAARHFDWLRRWVPRAARYAVVAFVVATLVLFSGRTALERWALRTLADSRRGASNVLLLMLDTARSFDMSLYGYERPTTPNLARWASQGARFDHVFSTASWTLPSMASVFTGHYPNELSADLVTPLDDAHPTLAEILRSNGYATGSFVANESYCTWQFGLARGFIHLDGYPVTLSMFVWSSALGRRLLVQPFVRQLLGFWNHPGYKRAETVNEEFLAWLDKTNGHPFFAFLNYYDAHHPALPPAPFDTLFGTVPPPRVPQLELAFDSLSPRELAQRHAQYDGAIAYMDGQIDRVLSELQRRGLLDNTLVVIVGDHGEHWGDHQRLSHGNSLYRQAIQVPLVMRYPRKVPSDAVITEIVSLVDLPATILDLVGASGQSPIPGHSLATLLRTGDFGHRGPVSASFSASAPKGGNGSVSLIADDMHYIRSPAGEEELYDAMRDPRDSLDLASTAAGIERLPRLRWLVDSIAGPNARAARR